MAQAAKRTRRPADMPPCLPHAGDINTAKLQAVAELRDRKRCKWFRRLAYLMFAIIALALASTVWIIHLNFGLMFNTEAKYSQPLKVFGLIVWHSGKASKFTGTRDDYGIPYDGTSRHWDEEGRLYKESTYDSGFHVVDRRWKNGQLRTEFHWRGNVTVLNAAKTDYSAPHGELWRYHNGIVRAQQQIVDGGAYGFYREYDEDGNLTLEGQLKAGRPIGEWRWYDGEGQVTVVTDPPLGRIDLKEGVLAGATLND
jgi:hypothetical protein